MPAFGHLSAHPSLPCKLGWAHSYVCCLIAPTAFMPSHSFAADTPLPRRLGLCGEHWRAIGASPTVISWLKHGVPVEWLGGRPPPPFYKVPLPSTHAQLQWWLHTEAPRFIKLGVLTQLGSRPSHCSNAFCVPKGDSWRLVVNLKHTNKFNVAHKCRFETLRYLQRYDLSNAWALKADMQDAFYQVPLHPSAVRYFCFEYAGCFYQLNSLPFGWNNSPYYFTKITRAFVAHLRAPAYSKVPEGCMYPKPSCGILASIGCRVLPYLDDFLFIFSDRASAAAGAEWIHALMYWLGFTPHPKKSIWEPTQQLEHLGITVDLASGTFTVPPAKVARLARMARNLIVAAKLNKRLVPKRDLASFCGYAQSVRLAVMPANLFLRSLYDDCSTVTGWGGDVRLSRQSFRDLEWWCNVPSQHLSSPMRLRPATVDLFVDASAQGWGAVIPDLGDSPDAVAAGSWSVAEQSMHINQKEMRAVSNALLSYAPVVKDRVVRLFEDNTVTQSVLGRFASRSTVLMDEYRRLWSLLDSLHVHLQVVRVSSEGNLADAPSRFVDRSDYKLHPSVFSQLDVLWGPHTIDLFASDSNTQLPAFYSLHRCPNTLGVNAFLQPWRGHNAYANPPFSSSVLLQLAQKVREEQADITVVVPCWPAQPWFHELMLLAADSICLPRATFSSRPGGCVPSSKWSLMAIRIQHSS